MATNGTTSKLQPAGILEASGANRLDVWSIFTPANMPKDAINLGQGFMSWAPPQYVRDAAIKALEDDIMANHYSHPRGRPRLRQALAKHYSSEFPNLPNGLDPETNLVVTAGANEGMYAALLAFLNPGDEVICIEPFFDQYLASIMFNQGVPVYVPLHPPKNVKPGEIADGQDWTVDFDELRAAITPKTKFIILNTPHNPVGKVFTRAELEKFAEIAIEKDIIILADEVYDCLTYDGAEHVRIATLPGMWERTLTVGSGGKSFASTGYRVGWLIGPAELIQPVLSASTRIIFCVNGIMQEAVAAGLEQAKERDFFAIQRKEYDERRKVLMKAFDDIGLEYTKPAGSYFLLVNFTRFKVPEGYEFPPQIIGRGKDFQTCWFLAQELKVVAIPPSEFYCAEHVSIGENFVRFAFCKDIPVLEEAAKRLHGVKQYLV